MIFNSQNNLKKRNIAGMQQMNAKAVFQDDFIQLISESKGIYTLHTCFTKSAGMYIKVEIVIEKKQIKYG